MKTHTAKLNSHDHLPLWGTGSAMREFIYVNDLADAVVLASKNYSSREPINIGSGQEVSITHLAELIKTEIGFNGPIKYDPSKPDGTPRKIVDCKKLTSLGWKPTVSLEQGIQRTYKWFLEQNISSNV